MPWPKGRGWRRRNSGAGRRLIRGFRRASLRSEPVKQSVFAVAETTQRSTGVANVAGLTGTRRDADACGMNVCWLADCAWVYSCPFQTPPPGRDSHSTRRVGLFSVIQIKGREAHLTWHDRVTARVTGSCRSEAVRPGPFPPVVSGARRKISQGVGLGCRIDGTHRIPPNDNTSGNAKVPCAMIRSWIRGVHRTASFYISNSEDVS